MLRNVRVILPDRILPTGNLAVVDGRIAAIGTEDFPGLGEVDGGGLFVAPGFVDGHCHGDGFNDFFREGEDVARTLLRNGTTTVLPTLSYSDMQTGNLRERLEAYWESRGPLQKVMAPALHLEGPYINYKYGAGSQHCRPRDPDPAEYDEIIAHFGDRIRQWTLAPELRGSRAFAEAAHQAGIILSAGHTEAALEDLEPLLDRGLRIATHWSNATGRPGNSRGVIAPGIDEFTLARDEISAEVICDAKGLHVHPLMVGLLYKVKGPDRILIITDATRKGSQGSAYNKEGMDVNINAEGQLSGSRLSMPGAARNFRRRTGCSLPEIFRMASLNAARLFGFGEDLGSIAIGKRAHLILVDEDLRIHCVHFPYPRSVRHCQ